MAFQVGTSRWVPLRGFKAEYFCFKESHVFVQVLSVVGPESSRANLFTLEVGVPDPLVCVAYNITR